MNIDLLKKLVPGEVDEYLVRNKVRADGRELHDHRPYQITRAVMGQELAPESEEAPEQKVSCAVKLGQTHVICSLVQKRQDSTILELSKPSIHLSLTLIKDSSLNIRRDLLEDKETQLKQSLRNKIEWSLANSDLNSRLSQAENPRQLSFAFTVVSDDGNLPSVLVAGANDLLQQMFVGCEPAAIWSCLVLCHTGNESHSFVVDPNLEETQNLSNNLLLVTALVSKDESMQVDEHGDDGQQGEAQLVVEKVAEALRTCYSQQLSTSLNYKPVTMTLAQMREGSSLAKGLAIKAINAHQTQRASHAMTIKL